MGKDIPKKIKLSNRQAFHIIVSGRVQGVGFRYFVREKALQYNLMGWVKNLSNGNVEIQVEGDINDIEVFIDFLKIGNGYSKITEIDKTKINLLKDQNSFQIKLR